MRTMMRTLAAVLLASLMLFGGAAAQAHDELVSSDPAANATLTQAPAELNLTYSANLMNIEGGNRVRVVDSTGASVAEGEPQVKGTTVTQPLKIKDASADETYTVTWRVVSSDGHPIQGTYTFSVGAGKAAAPSQDAGTGESSQAAADTQNSTKSDSDSGVNDWRRCRFLRRAGCGDSRPAQKTFCITPCTPVTLLGSFRTSRPLAGAALGSSRRLRHVRLKVAE